jgi:hypothetical protein
MTEKLTATKVRVFQLMVLRLALELLEAALTGNYGPQSLGSRQFLSTKTLTGLYVVKRPRFILTIIWHFDRCPHGNLPNEARSLATAPPETVPAAFPQLFRM